MALRPVMKVRIVTAKRLGCSTDSTTRMRMVVCFAPMLPAASTVWKLTVRMALRRKITWLEVQEKVMAVELFGRTDLLDEALVEHGDAVGKRQASSCSWVR